MGVKRAQAINQVLDFRKYCKHVRTLTHSQPQVSVSPLESTVEATLQSNSFECHTPEAILVQTSLIASLSRLARLAELANDILNSHVTW